MKKTHPVIAFGLLLIFILVLLLSDYFFGVFRRIHLVRTKFSSIVPAEPLVYLQITDLRTHLEQCAQHPHYQQFLSSRLLRQIQAAPEWQEFSVSFERFWNGLAINPMRFIGTDLSISLYKSPPYSTVPAVVLLSRVDGVSRLAERLLYLVERVSGQIGIDVAHIVEHIAVYMIKQPDMVFPLYYSVIDELAIISTSLPLMQKTIQRAVGAGEKSEPNRSMVLSEHEAFFANVTDTHRESTFLTAYLELSPVFEELSSNLLFRSLNLVTKADVLAMADFPPAAIWGEMFADSIQIKTALYSSAPPEKSWKTVSTKGRTVELLPVSEHSTCWENLNEQFVLVGGVHKPLLPEFFRSLQTLFPQQAWPLPFDIEKSEQVQIFGEIVECRLSNTLFGTLYTIPDLLCASDTSDDPEHVISTTDQVVNNWIEQNMTPMARRTMLRQLKTSHQKTMISQVQLMFHDIFCYTAFQEKPGPTFTLLTTNSEVIKEQIDRLLSNSAEPRYFCMAPTENAVGQDVKEGKNCNNVSLVRGSRDEMPVIQWWIQPERLAKFLDDISKTTTFTLLLPQQEYHQFYQNLPTILLVLESLPPLFLETGLQEHGIFTRLRTENAAAK